MPEEMVFAQQSERGSVCYLILPVVLERDSKLPQLEHPLPHVDEPGILEQHCVDGGNSRAGFAQLSVIHEGRRQVVEDNGFTTHMQARKALIRVRGMKLEDRSREDF